jgi:hypothetical protein
MADLKKKKNIVSPLSCASKLGKLHQKCMAFSSSAMWILKTWVVFQIQTWGNFCWRLRVFLSYRHRLHGWRAGESSWNCQWRLTKYHFWDHCWVYPVVWNSPAAHALAGGLCTARAMVIHHWAEAAVNFACKKQGCNYLLYSPNFALCDFLCPRMKLQLGGRCVWDIPEIQECLLTAVHMIQKSQYLWCLQQWQNTGPTT